MDKAMDQNVDVMKEFSEFLENLDLNLFENDSNLEMVGHEENEFGFMFSKGGGSRPRTAIE